MLDSIMAIGTTTTMTPLVEEEESPLSKCVGSGSGGGCCTTSSACSTFADNEDNHHNTNINNNNVIPLSAASSYRYYKSPLLDDAELAKEMNSLSVQERNKVLEELHGVADLVPETESFMQDVIQKLDRELDQLPNSIDRKAYDRARFLKPTLEDDIPWKLLFLRADNYDPFDAARRIVRYYQDKLDLFGEDKLVKKITLDDLSDYDGDMEVLKQGAFILLPHRDNAGRPIWFSDMSKFDYDDNDSLLRVVWYQIMSSLEDETVQLKGICNVQYWLGSSSWKVPGSSFQKWQNGMVRGGKILVNMPIRITAFHFCHNQNKKSLAGVGVNLIMSIFRRALGKDVRLHLRTHFGSDVEIQYSLLAYGITCPSISGTEKMKFHHQYIQQRRIQDRTEWNALLLRQNIDTTTTNKNSSNNNNNSSIIIPFPLPNDVLFGRGVPYQKFSGNEKLSHHVKTLLEEYCKSTNSRFDKTCIHLNVIKTVQEVFGGRFLERHSKVGWKIVNETTARKKVCSAFRSQMTKLANTNTNTTSNTNTSTAKDGGTGESSSFSPRTTTTTTTTNKNNNKMNKNKKGSTKRNNTASASSSSSLKSTSTNSMITTTTTTTSLTSMTANGYYTSNLQQQQQEMQNSSKRLRYDPGMMVRACDDNNNNNIGMMMMTRMLFSRNNPPNNTTTTNTTTTTTTNHNGHHQHQQRQQQATAPAFPQIFLQN